jgi:hypothetical protein
MSAKPFPREIYYPRAMSQLRFRILGVRYSTAREWLRLWASLYEADDDEEYSDLIATAKHKSLLAEDFIRIGKWKDNTKAEAKWKPNVAFVAYPIWKQAAEELPKCPASNEVEAFLKDWSNRNIWINTQTGLSRRNPLAGPVQPHCSISSAEDVSLSLTRGQGQQSPYCMTLLPRTMFTGI